MIVFLRLWNMNHWSPFSRWCKFDRNEVVMILFNSFAIKNRTVLHACSCIKMQACKFQCWRFEVVLLSFPSDSTNITTLEWLCLYARKGERPFKAEPPTWVVRIKNEQSCRCVLHIFNVHCDKVKRNTFVSPSFFKKKTQKYPIRARKKKKEKKKRKCRHFETNTILQLLGTGCRLWSN